MAKTGERAVAKRNAILIGNSNRIGLAATRRLLASGWDVVGISSGTMGSRLHIQQLERPGSGIDNRHFSNQRRD